MNALLQVSKKYFLLQDEDVRVLATSTFASLIRLVPLDSSSSSSSSPPPDALPLDMSRKKEDERRFLDQLTCPDRLEEYPVGVKVNAELRPYQRAGVNWLAFLNRYKLHGVLCDDMGLGKTLQTVVMLASDHYYMQQRIKGGDYS